MSDQLLTTIELETTAAGAAKHAANSRRYGRPVFGPDWAETLAAVCRQALAQAAEIERLREVLRDIAATAVQNAHGDYLYGSCQQIEAAARAALAKEPPCP